MRIRVCGVGFELGRAVLGVAALLAGCGDGGRTERSLAVGAGATFRANDGPSRAAGYELAVVIEQVMTTSHPTCPALPKTLRLFVNDQEVSPAFDASGCLNTQVAQGLFPQIGPVTVDAKDGDEPLAHAEFENLAPGGGATLAVPADGQVHAGDEIVVVPPPELPTGEASLSDFYPLEDSSVANKLYAPSLAERLADGVHVKVPAFSGRAAVTFGGMPYVPQATTSCPGFDFCVADADNTLGPVFVTETP